MKINVKVTQEHIDEGCPGRVDACALHRALRRLVKPGVIFRVSPSMGNLYGGFISFYIPGKDAGLHVDLPVEVGRMLRLWDKGQMELQPFELELDIPEEVLR